MNHYKNIHSAFIIIIAFLISLFFSSAAFARINIVAAENFYGDIAKQVGGDYVDVISVMQNPNEDPHLFSVSPSMARTVAKADIVVYNGLHLDDWMTRLLSVQPEKNHSVLVVSDLIHAKPEDNPHIWYNPKTMKIYAQALTEQLIKLDPLHANYYHTQLEKIMQQQQAFEALLQQLNQQFRGTPITATEPIFNEMAQALGLKMLNFDFQLSVIHEAGPTSSQMRQMLSDLKNKRVKLLIYSQQTTDPSIENIKKIAIQNHIPIVGISEMLPPNMTYYPWMEQQLKQISNALSQ